MKKLNIFVLLTLLSLTTLAEDKKKSDDGEKPCVDPVAKLKVLDPKFKDTISKASAMVQYPKNSLTGDETYQLCTLIKKATDFASINSNIKAMAKRRNISATAFVNDVLAKESCGSLGPDGGTVVTQAMYYNHYNLQPIFENGLDFDKPIKDFDGTLKKPLELAQANFKKATTGKDKARWAKVKAAIAKASR